MRPRVLVTGATGLLGPYLIETAAQIGDVAGLARGGSDIDCDLTDPTAVRRAMQEVNPDLIFHAAAMTDVDACERTPEAARNINCAAVGYLLEHLSADAAFVLFSSIAVYPDAEGPHREGDEAPVNVYGKSKLDAEMTVAKHAKSLIVRTSMFGPSLNPRRRSISDFVRDRLLAGEELVLFTDERFSPLHVRTLAEMTVEMCDRDIRGTFNLASREGMTKSEFGISVARHLGLPESRIVLRSSRDVPGRTNRGLDMRLDPTRAERILGRSMPRLEEEIRRL